MRGCRLCCALAVQCEGSQQEASQENFYSGIICSRTYFLIAGLPWRARPVSTLLRQENSDQRFQQSHQRFKFN